MQAGAIPIAVRGAAVVGRLPEPSVTIAALGDLMLVGEWQAPAPGRTAGFAALASEVAGDDLVFANLETACPGTEGWIPKEPRVVADPDCVAGVLRAIGVDLVSVANNHVFDCYRSGFEALRGALGRAGVAALGAGAGAAEAAAPSTLERRGVRFGWLAYADAATRPSHLAADGGFGVNPFDRVRAAAEVETLAARVDHVIVSLHWGVEYCNIPAPAQVAVARALIAAGARLVIGHHAHVVQGIETWGRGAVAYNLGNATTADLAVGGRLAIRQTPRTRSSLVLRAAFDERRLLALELVPIRSERGVVLVGDALARRHLERAMRRLTRGVTPRLWRRTRLYEDVALRTLRKLHPRVVGSVRPRHAVTLAQNLWGALRGRAPH